MMAGFLDRCPADMTETVTPTAATAPDLPQTAHKPGRRPGRQRRQSGTRNSEPKAQHGAAPQVARPSRTLPLLERLASLHPSLFGETFLPLKRGIYEDLLAAHPEDLDPQELKLALAQHTRSTRYLHGVAAGQPRHDLQAQPVEAMAPEHVHHALLEVFRRRQLRSAEDLKPKLQRRIVEAFEASGLSAQDYAALVRGRDAVANAVLDAALTEAGARAAKDEALLRAFEASSQSVEAFADMYGLSPRHAAQTLERARQRRAAVASRDS